MTSVTVCLFARIAQSAIASLLAQAFRTKCEYAQSAALKKCNLVTGIENTRWLFLPQAFNHQAGTGWSSDVGDAYKVVAANASNIFT